MTRKSLRLIAGLVGAAFACASAFAESGDPFGAADCREAHLDKVVGGKVVGSEPVVVCKLTSRTAALLAPAPPRPRPRPPAAAAAGARPAPPAPAREVDHVA